MPKRTVPKRTTPQRTIPKRTTPEDITKYLQRLVVKLRDDVRVPKNKAKSDAYQDVLESEMKKLPIGYQKLDISPMFAISYLGKIRNLIEWAKKLNPEYRPPVFETYFFIFVPYHMDPRALVSVLSGLGIVETAYVEPSYGEPSAYSGVTPDDSRQVYLNAAPVGIGAESAWQKGGDGKGIKFIDIERSWYLEHEDLLNADGQPKVKLMDGIDLDNAPLLEEHGTSVLGITVASDNGRCCVGIAPNVKSVEVVSYEQLNGQNLPAAIAFAANELKNLQGVLLIEVQITNPGYLPVEATQANFHAIELATAANVIVVEPAGNGGSSKYPKKGNLDNYSRNGDYILRRGDPSFKDSGAIMVGAAKPGTLSRASISNYGSRVDCFAQGENVFTLGTPDYTGYLTKPDFNGTSAASAIIAGAALSIQSIAKAGRGPLNPKNLRALLSDPTRNSSNPLDCNTASRNGSLDKIGVMPNLRWIINNSNL
jgi:serine protease